MPKVTLQFTHLVQDSQDYGSDDEHMVSRAFFDVGCAGRTVASHADVKLVVGGDYASDPLEVGRPAGYQGPFDHAKFSDAVSQYVRRAVGPEAIGIRLGPGARNVRMRNNTFQCPWTVSFDVAEGDPAGW